MLKFGCRASTEDIPTDVLLREIKLAENVGFDFVVVADHFHPWFHSHGRASHGWVVMTVAAAKTERIELGTGATTPTFRYHPAIVAQTFATLAHMFEGRIFIAVGIGEAMNERPLGFSWPNYDERSTRLVEAVQIIRRLWTEDFVTFEGQYYRLKQANLYTKPKIPPKLYMAAIGRKSGRLAGIYSDGLYTLLMKRGDYLEKLFPAFEAGAREVGKNPKDLDKMILLNLSYNPDYDKALKQVKYWKPVLLPNVFDSPISDPREMDRESANIPDQELTNGWIPCTSMEECLKNVEEFIHLGFNRIEIHSFSPDQKRFLEWLKEPLTDLRRQFS